jgi:hypothetical protein
MLGYWEERHGDAAAPRRATIDPADFADIVTQTFVIGRERPGVYPFRLAGALLDDLHRGPLFGFHFVQLWAAADRPKIHTAVEAALAGRRSLIATVHGRSFLGAEARLEMLLAPLAGHDGQIDRLLGFYQPVSALFRLQNQRIERLFLQDIAFADGGDPLASPLRLAAVDGRLIA